MPPVPSLPGDRIVRALERTGFKVASVRGSHHIMRHPDGRGTTVPVHPGRDVATGTLRGILSDVGMSIEELQRLIGARTRQPAWPYAHGAERARDVSALKRPIPSDVREVLDHSVPVPA
jgi:predicted RNA binding protein YcfA (HicA-like mRNA interferase family)